MQQGLCSALQQQQQQQQQRRWRPALDASSQVPERAAASCIHRGNCCRCRCCSVAAAVAAVALGRHMRPVSCCHSRGSGRCVACATSCRQSHGRHGRAAVAAMAAATACAAAAALLQPRLQLLHAPGQLLSQPQQRPLHAATAAALSAAAAIARAPRQLLPQLRQQPLHAVPPGKCSPGTDEWCSGWRLATAMHAAHDSFLRALRAPAGGLHKDSTVSQPPCISRAAIFGTPWDISGNESSFGTAASCICRVAGVIHLSDGGRGWRELHDWAAEQQQPMRFAALRRAQ